MVNFSVFRARPLTFFIGSVVLLVGGCASIDLLEKTPKCFAPGTVAKHRCFYNLQVTEVISADVIRAKVPVGVLDHNAKHSSFTALGGLIGSKVNRDHYGDAEYELKIENPLGLTLKPNGVYEFRGIKGKASVEAIGDARYPEDQGEDQGKDPDKISQNAETGLYARHAPQCCMCESCQSGCFCPGEAGCPWCARADLAAFLARATIKNDTVDIRTATGLKQSGKSSEVVSEKFLALLSGSKNRGNLSVKSMANYSYDDKFAPACLTRNS